MADKIQDLIKIGEKVKAFREANSFSMTNFAKITGVSAPTLCRIEKGGNYTKGKLDAVCAIMGIDSEDLLKTDVLRIPLESVREQIASQVKKLGLRKTELNQIKREQADFHGPSYLVKRAMEEGFLNKFREVNEIQRFIEEEYGVTLLSSSITNALFRKKGIVYRPSGTAKYNQYKYVRGKSKK